jgi:hypothetical protein
MERKTFLKHRTYRARDKQMSQRIVTMCRFERKQLSTLRHTQKTSSLGTMDND